MRSLLQNRSLLSLVFLFSLMSHVSLISSSPMPMGQHQCLNDQRSTLVQLREDILNYSSPPRDSFPENSSMKVKGWDLERDCCSWEGVTCDTAGHVIGLDLSYSMLSGNISFVFYLSHLQHLNLSGNNFQLTPIPSGFGRLGNLTHLNLSSSCFSYQIPLEISSLTRLISLDLSNSISIPYCVSLPHNDILTWIRNFELHRLRLEQPNLKTFVKNLSALTEVYLDNVDLSAQGSDWAVALSYALPNIEVLSLSDCGLSGSMHPSLSRLHFLSILNLDNNPLSSVAPNFLANFSNLVALSLGSCDLYGIFHDDVFLLPKLRTIDLSDNSLLTGQLPEFSSNNSLQVLSLEGTNFYGKLPDSIGNLKVLTNLLLGGCNFSGLIPSSLLNLARIVELDLADNRFSGSIPPFHGNGLVYLDLSSNLLNGVVYSSLFTLPSLQELHLSGNRFSSQLEEFLNASSSVLEYVDLDGNELEGPIPRSISEIPGLSYLSLAGNHFNGTIKLGMFQNLKYLYSIDLADNNLSIERDNSTFTFPQLAVLSLSSCNLTEFPDFLRNQVHLRSLILSNNQIHGYVPNWIWKDNLVYLELSHNAIDFLEQPLLGDSNNSTTIFNGNGNHSSPMLEFLEMRSCNISRFPDFLKNQDRLFDLDLSDNKIDGQIPSWIWTKNLAVLNLSHNFLNALDQFLPNVSLTLLEILDLHHNMLQGSFPTVICNSSILKFVDASHNHLHGVIPECLGKFGNLYVLNLRDNNFHRMPPDLALASRLESLNINGNQLKGQVPRSLANCTMLKVLDLGNNMIFDTFPFWLEKLPSLQVLVLRANRFYGPIQHPEIKSVFPKLGIVDLSSNEFTGELSKDFFQSLKAMAMINENKSEPKYVFGVYGMFYQDSVTIVSKGLEMELVRILTIFTSLDLSNNRFYGEIPEEIGDLKSLIVLNLSRNGFVSRIPSSLGGLSELESLDLSQNKLSGEIPPQLTSLTFLSVLNLSYNQLEGSIPQGKQFNTFSNDSYKGNVRLCGLPLSKKCKEGSDAMLPPLQGERSDAENIFDWKIVLMGYGSGLVIGFSIGYIILCKMEDKWFMSWFVNLQGRMRKHGRRSKPGRRFQSGR